MIFKGLEADLELDQFFGIQQSKLTLCNIFFVFVSVVEAILAVERVVAAAGAFLVDEGAAEVAHPCKGVGVIPISRGPVVTPNNAPRILAGARICY